LGGIIIGWLSDSHISVSGPAAGLTVIVAAGISEVGGFSQFGLAVFLSGLLQIIFGLLKGGSIGDYFPTATIKGMLSAIGLILILKQLPNAFGLPIGSWDFKSSHQGIMLISVLSLGIMILWDHLATKGIGFFKLIPGPLVAVLVGILVNEFFGLVPSSSLVSIPSGLFGDFNMPEISALSPVVLKIAFTLAIVASLETLLCVDAADKLDPEKRTTSKNRELLAQGVGNSLSGLFGGLPVTAVIVRTSANVNAGAKTKWSAIFHGAWLFLCVLFLPHLLNKIPLATLACVLLMVGYKLTKPSFYLEMQKRGWDQLVVFCSTIGAILATDLLKGIFIGLLVAIVIEFKNLGLRAVEVVETETSIEFTFHKNISFFHKAILSKTLKKISGKKLISFIGVNNVKIHVDVKEMMDDFKREALNKNIEVKFV